MPHEHSIHLYRKLLRDARHFPVLPIRRKLRYNYREMFDLHREETCSQNIKELMQAGHAALRVLAWLKSLPEVGYYHVTLHFM